MELSRGKRITSAVLSSVFTVTSLMTVLPTFVAAAEEEKLLYTDDGFSYVVNDGGTVTIKGFNSETVTDYFKDRPLTFPSIIDGKTVTAIDSGKQFQYLYCTEINLPEKVETISDWAFANNYSTMEVTIPKTVTKAIRPFTYSKALEKATFEDGITEIPESILDATDVKVIVIPDSVTKINKSAFDGNGTLEEIHLSDNVKYIGYRGFYGCTALKVLDIPKELDYIGSYAFCEDHSLETITVPTTWTFDPEGQQFFTGSGIKEITFEDGITEIPHEICYSCNSLETINIPDSVTSIKSGAFYQCPSIKDPKLPDSIETIGDSAFRRCTGIEHLDLPKNLKTLENMAFGDTTGLKYLYVPHEINAGANMRGVCVFYGSGIEKLVFADGITYLNAMTAGLKNLTDVTIPESVTGIYNRAFDDDQSLSYVKLPDGLVDFTGGDIFRNCYSLTELTIPKGIKCYNGWEFVHTPSLEEVYFQDGMEKIPDNLFTDCHPLRVVHIPESVTEIGANAFNGCENLQELDMTQTSIKTNFRSFHYTDNLWDSRVSLCERGDLFVNKTTVSSADGTSLSNYTVHYKINPIYLDGFKKASIRVFTSTPKTLAEESIGALEAVKNDYGFTYDLERTEDTIRFSVRNPADKEIEVTIDFSAMIKNYNEYETRHIITSNDSFSGMSLNAPESVGKNGGKPSFWVYGYADFGKEVSILVNGAEYKKVTASQYTGKYSLQIEADEVDGAITVQAVCGDKKTDVVTISVADSIPVLKDFDVSHFAHDKWTFDMTDMFTTGYSPYVPINPSNPLEFDVDMDNDDNVAKVFVESDTNGKRSYIGLDKNSEDGRWKGEGFFDTAIPGNLTVRSIPMNKEDTLTVKRDSEGTVESVKNKAGKELLKQEEGASKDPAEKFVERTEQTIVETGNSNIAISFRKKTKSDTGSAPYLPPDEPEEEDFELDVFEGGVDSIDIEGKTLKPIDIVEDHNDFKFEKSNTKVIDDNGEEHEYYVRVITKDDQEFAQALTKSIPLSSGGTDKRTVNDFLTDKEIGRIIEGIVVADLNKGLDSASLQLITYSGDGDVDGLIKDLSVGAGTSWALEEGVKNTVLKDVAGYGGAAITSAQAAYELYGHYVSHDSRCVKIDYSKDQFVRDNATKLKVTSASLFLGRAAIAGVAIKGSFMLAAAGLAFWPGLVAAAALSFGVWALGKWYDKLEKDLDDVTDPNTPSGRFNSEIDPSGIAYEWLPSNPVKGVTAEIYYQDKDGKAVKWNAEDYDQINPQITDSAGWFAWDVPEGMWQVRLSGEGYEDAQSEWLPVLPVQTDVNIKMTSTAPAKVIDAGFGDGKIFLTFSKHILDSSATIDSIAVLDDGEIPVYFSIAPFKEEDNDTEASMTYILTPSSKITSIDKKSVTVSSNVLSYAGVPCTTQSINVRALTDEELAQYVQPASADLGDVNEDGKIDAKDASLILVEYSKASTGAESGFNESQKLAGEVNGDGKIDAKDASAILAYYAMASTATGDVPTLKEFIANKAA